MAKILITGAGSGIGRAIAEVLAKRGEELVLAGRRREPLEATLAALCAGDHQVLCLDQADPESLRAAFRQLADADVALEAVIANAGIGGSNTYGAEDRWEEVLGVNLTGTYRLVHEALPLLKRRSREYGHVVLVSSILARLGVPGYSAYCASKAGLLGLARSLAATWASEKILVNSVLPGWVDTDMAREGLEGMAEATGRPYQEIREAQLAVVPLKKMSQPQEIAGLIDYLTSPGQTSITGASMDINNGAWMAS